MLANHYDVFEQQYDVLGKLSSQWAGDECCSKNVGVWCRKGGWTYLNGRVGSNCIFERIQNCQASCIMECWPSTCCCFYLLSSAPFLLVPQLIWAFYLTMACFCLKSSHSFSDALSSLICHHHHFHWYCCFRCSCIGRFHVNIKLWKTL